MKFSVLIISLSFGWAVLEASPWDLDRETRDLLNAQIDAVHQGRSKEAAAQGKTDYMIDYERKRINIHSRNCRYCKHSEQLKRSHFEKKWPDQPEGHCFGSTLFLVQYLLAHPDSIFHSCEEILSEIQNEPNFEEIVHSFSMNQHSYYHFQGLHDPLELNPERMKDYFLALIGTKPSEYHVLPFSADNGTFDKTTIYGFLKTLSDQLIMVGYTDKEGYNHCIALSTQPEKLFVFDSNLGLYQFPDLETLSWNSEKALQDCRFRWLATFSLKTTPL